MTDHAPVLLVESLSVRRGERLELEEVPQLEVVVLLEVEELLVVVVGRSRHRSPRFL